MAAIRAVNLVKKYGELVAVDKVSLEINDSECFGLLGPNGAGKTTLIRMLTGVSPPTAGEIWVLGKELRAHSREVKAALGVVPQIDNLDPDLTVLQNLLTFSRYFDIPADEARRRSLELLQLFELQGKMNNNIRELSGGMKRRLLLARGLINMPRMVVLDEPTIGLDPQSKYMVWNKLTELKSKGVTQLLSTQNMEEAAALCDRVAIMHQGRILSLDTTIELIKRYVGKEVGEAEVSPADRAGIVKELEEHGFEFEEYWGRIYIFHIDGRMPSIDRLQIRRRPGTLEDVFFRLTGRSLSE